MKEDWNGIHIVLDFLRFEVKGERKTIPEQKQQGNSKTVQHWKNLIYGKI